MSQNGKPIDPPWLPDDYERNRNRFPADELRKFAGKYVAFSMDGAQILASGDTDAEMEAHLIAAGIDPARVVESYIDPPRHPLTPSPAHPRTFP